jgi:hypothetical protein
LIHVDVAIAADEVDLGEGAPLLTINVARGLVAPVAPDTGGTDAMDAPGTTTLPQCGSGTSKTTAPPPHADPSPVSPAPRPE